MDTITDEPQVTSVPTAGFRQAPDGEVADLDEGKREALFRVPWEVLDSYRSDFTRDCFNEYLSSRLPVMCWQHQKAEPIGRTTAWQQGTRAHEFTMQFSDFDAVPMARRAWSQMDDGTITDVSFAYTNAKVIPHPTVKGGYRHTKANMPELSPVTVGSIPGASVTGVRAQADASGIAELVNAGVIDPEEGRRMLAEAGFVESITLNGQRALTITVGDDGHPTTTSTGDDGADGADDDGLGQAADLIGAVDATLDEAVGIINANDTSTWPPAAQQQAMLTVAAAAGIDQVMDELGIFDPDDSDDGGDPQAVTATSSERAAKEPVSDKPWSDFSQADYTDAQWKRACLLWDDAKDGKQAGSLPVREPDGTLNRNAVHAAAGRLSQTSGDKAGAAKKLLSLYHVLGEDPPGSLLQAAGSGSRADGAPEFDAEATAAFARLGRIPLAR